MLQVLGVGGAWILKNWSSLLALVGSVFSLIYSYNANRLSDKANDIAKRNLEFTERQVVNELTPALSVALGTSAACERDGIYQIRGDLSLTNKGGRVDITKYWLEYHYLSSNRSEEKELSDGKFTLTAQDFPLQKGYCIEIPTASIERVKMQVKVKYMDPVTNTSEEQTLCEQTPDIPESYFIQ